MNVQAIDFRQKYPTYRDFLVAIQSHDRQRAKSSLKMMEKIVDEDDLVDDYFEPLRAGDFRADTYIQQKYQQVMTLAV